MEPASQIDLQHHRGGKHQQPHPGNDGAGDQGAAALGFVRLLQDRRVAFGELLRGWQQPGFEQIGRQPVVREGFG